MGVLDISFKEPVDPYQIRESILSQSLPVRVSVGLEDVRALSINLITDAALKGGIDPLAFVPLGSMKRNALKYGPELRVEITVHEKIYVGSTNSRGLSLTYDDPLDREITELIKRFREFLPDFRLEIEDDEGRLVSLSHVTY